MPSLYTLCQDYDLAPAFVATLPCLALLARTDYAAAVHAFRDLCGDYDIVPAAAVRLRDIIL